MAEKLTLNRANADPTAPGNPGELTFVKTNDGTKVKAFLTGSNNIPLPLVGAGGIVFLGSAGEQPTIPPEPETLYVNTFDKMLHFVGPDSNVLAYPITEGSILANVYYEQAAAPVAATGNTPTLMLDMTNTFEPGMYLIDIMYGWTCDSTGRDFIAEFLVDGVLTGQPHQQEPQDAAGSSAWTNTNQTQTGSKRLIVDFTAGGTHCITTQFRCNANGTSVSMFDCTIVAWNLTGLA
jgi:hypothetical protein